MNIFELTVATSKQIRQTKPDLSVAELARIQTRAHKRLCQTRNWLRVPIQKCSPELEALKSIFKN